MGLFNWLMKGMGFEEENENASKESRKEKKERKKKNKKQTEATQTEQQLSFDGASDGETSYASNRDQFNTAGRFYAGDSNSGYLGQQNMGGYGTKNVVFYYPKNYQDVQKIVDLLKQGESAIINLDGISDDEAQRMLDFVSGAVYALNGSTQRVSGNIFLLTPEGLNIMVPSDDENQ